jgi:hypothetical protein
MTRFPTIDDLLVSRARAMAEHDGATLSVVHLTGAAHQLQAELIAARDHQVVNFRAPPAIAAPAQPVEQVEAQVAAPEKQDNQEADAPAADAGESRGAADEDDAS